MPVGSMRLSVRKGSENNSVILYLQSRHFRDTMPIVRGTSINVTSADFEVYREGVNPLDVLYDVVQACPYVTIGRTGSRYEVNNFNQVRKQEL